MFINWKSLIQVFGIESCEMLCQHEYLVKAEGELRHREGENVCARKGERESNELCV